MHRAPNAVALSLLALAVPLALAGLAPRAPAQAFTLPPHFEVVALPGAYNLPVGLTFAADGTAFLLQKPGIISVLDPAGTLQAAPFLDLSAEVNNDWDRGLLGVALHPGFLPDGGATSWVYLLYTVSPVPPNDNGFNQNNQYSFSRLTRYRATTGAGGLVADTASRQILLGHQNADGTVPDGIASIHNSHSNGSLRFADDGSLLLACGDGAHYDFQDNGGNDNAGFDTFTHPVTGKKGPTPKVQDAGAFRAQDLRSLSGKVLRIDPETGLGYPSNPFFDGDPASLASRVWALGLRNPFRMSLVPGTGAADPAVGAPNLVLVGDVGWNTWEELNLVRTGGENFGWPCYEGNPAQGGYQTYNPADPSKVDCFSPVSGTLTAPILAWHHSNANALKPTGIYVDGNGAPLPGFKGNCSIGGPIYTGGSYPAEYVGRLFFIDYGQQFIKTAEFDASWNLVAVRDFAGQTGALVGLERHPLTGDLWALSLTSNQVLRIGYGANLTPVAVASATPTLGPAPLTVSFTGSASHDPDNDPIAYDWDFGDGSAHSSAPNPGHDYLVDGVYEATLTVSDPLGLSGASVVQVAVGNGPPTASILSPANGALYAPPQTLLLVGAGTDPESAPLDYAWSVDLHHATHVHPGVMQATGSTAEFPIETSPEDDELLYYRVNLTVTDDAGLSATAHVWVYPQAGLRDVAGTALPISRMDTLVPATPTGGGNHDIEVVRDAKLPAVGSGDSAAQFDTYHGGAQGNDDWIGYALATPPADEQRFVGLTFQEGKHFVDGGWWEDLRVEVRAGGTWSTVPGLSIDPPYPFALAGQPFFDGLNFQTYTLRFEPSAGDAIRLRGNPGGSAGFTSVGELRAQAIAAPAASDVSDISAQGTIVAKLFELQPPVPLGSGNQDPETIRNGTAPAPGSTSFLAQYDTFHLGQQAGEDWIGYGYPTQRTFTRVVFEEGRDNADGGAFTALGLQVQKANGAWVAVPGVTVTPPYDGLDGIGYETFRLDFPPVAGRAIRLIGPPAGSNAYISVGELAVDEPVLPGGCGWSAYGSAAGANTLVLDSDTPPALGFPVELHSSGATGPCAGALLVAFAPAALPLQGGTLLVEPSAMLFINLGFNATGSFALTGTLPSTPSLAGASVWLQAVAFTQPAPFGTRFSNGLKLTLCTW